MDQATEAAALRARRRRLAEQVEYGIADRKELKATLDAILEIDRRLTEMGANDGEQQT